MFLLMLATGARPAEIVPSHRSGHIALLKSEVLPDRGTVTIRSAKVIAGRRGIVRELRISDEMMEMVCEAGRKNPSKHVFPEIKNLHRYFDRILKVSRSKNIRVPTTEGVGLRRHNNLTILAN